MTDFIKLYFNPKEVFDIALKYTSRQDLEHILDAMHNHPENIISHNNETTIMHNNASIHIQLRPKWFFFDAHDMLNIYKNRYLPWIARNIQKRFDDGMLNVSTNCINYV